MSWQCSAEEYNDISAMFSKKYIVNCSLDIIIFLLELNLSIWHRYFLIATAMFATAQGEPILQPSQFTQLIVNIPNHSQEFGLNSATYYGSQ